MIPPPSMEWVEANFPKWALDADRKVPRDRLIVGMRVFDVLYGGYYGCPYGTVTSVSEDGEGCSVLHDNGSQSGSASSYFVPMPPEHDPRHST